MFIVEDYPTAVIFCVITMLCWGSWGNTQKLAAKTWRYELFYWDYVIGIVLLSVVFGFTLGSMGEQGRSFTTDLAQVSSDNLWSAILGGVIFNASNILLSASISIAGMAVAFPVGVGLALVLGVILNYNSASKDDPIILFGGVALIMVAIIFNGIASGKMATGDKKSSSKGIWLAVIAGMMLDRGRALGARCFSFTPSQWKGTKRKDLFQCEILAQLLPEERELLPRLKKRDGRLVYRTDPLDAAGLGLVFLQRAGERRPVMYDAPAKFMGLVEEVDHE